MSRRRSKERADFLGGILISAVEGPYLQGFLTGRNYHVNIDDWSETSIEVREFCERTGEPIGEWERVDIEVIARGLGRILRDEDGAGAYGLKESIAKANRENDGGMLDAYDDAAIVQAGLFGKVIYG